MPRGPEHIYYCSFVESVNNFHLVHPIFSDLLQHFHKTVNTFIIVTHLWCLLAATGGRSERQLHLSVPAYTQSCWHLLPMMWWNQSELWPCALWGSKMDGGGGFLEKELSATVRKTCCLWNDNVERRTNPKAEIDFTHTKKHNFTFKNNVISFQNGICWSNDTRKPSYHWFA